MREDGASHVVALGYYIAEIGVFAIYKHRLFAKTLLVEIAHKIGVGAQIIYSRRQ